MARIRLAHWHDGHNPGDEVDVPDDELPGLVRDGRVAEILDGRLLPPAVATAVNATGEPEPVLTVEQVETMQAAAEPPSRRRRKEQ